MLVYQNVGCKGKSGPGKIHEVILVHIGAIVRILFREVSPCFFSRYKSQEVAVHLLWLKNVVTILPTGSWKSLIYQLYATAKEMQMNAIVLIVSPLERIMKDQIVEIEEVGIP